MTFTNDLTQSLSPTEIPPFQLDQPRLPSNTPVETLAVNSVQVFLSDGRTLVLKAKPGQGLYKVNELKMPDGRKVLTHEVFIADGSER